MGESDNDQDNNNEDDDFQSKLNKKQRKKMKRQNKDKILIGKGSVNNTNQFNKSEDSKKIKKQPFKKNIITD